MKKRVLFLVFVSFFHVVAVLFLLIGAFMFVKGLIMGQSLFVGNKEGK